MIGSIADRLEHIAKELYRGNKSDFARAINKKPQNVYQYIRGDRTPGAEFLYQLTTIGININWVLTGEGEMRIKNQYLSEVDFPLEEANVAKLITSITNRLQRVDFSQEIKINILQETLNRIDIEQNSYFINNEIRMLE